MLTSLGVREIRGDGFVGDGRDGLPVPEVRGGLDFEDQPALRSVTQLHAAGEALHSPVGRVQEGDEGDVRAVRDER